MSQPSQSTPRASYPCHVCAGTMLPGVTYTIPREYDPTKPSCGKLVVNPTMGACAAGFDFMAQKIVDCGMCNGAGWVNERRRPNARRLKADRRATGMQSEIGSRSFNEWFVKDYRPDPDMPVKEKMRLAWNARGSPSAELGTTPECQQTINHMSRQAELLDEEGNDVSAGVMRDAMKVLVAEHQRANLLEKERDQQTRFKYQANERADKAEAAMSSPSATTVRSVVEKIIHDLDAEGRASVVVAWGRQDGEPTIRKWLDEWVKKNASDSGFSRG